VTEEPAAALAAPAVQTAPARTAARPARRKAAAPAAAPQPAQPAPVVIIRESAPQHAAPKPDRLDDIDLYKTANEAIMN
jgi:hypothetical protein